MTSQNVNALNLLIWRASDIFFKVLSNVESHSSFLHQRQFRLQSLTDESESHENWNEDRLNSDKDTENEDDKSLKDLFDIVSFDYS